jgi:uncharacterized membrane protein YbhN (UPF0104 family)
VHQLTTRGSGSAVRRWRRLQLVALAAALVLMVVLVAGLGPRAIAAQTAGAGAGAAWLLVAYAAGTAIGALPWHALLPEGVRPGLRAAVESRFAASGANAILPLLGIGGEPVRLLWMRPSDRAAGVAAIVLDRLIYVAASAVFLLAAAIAALGLRALPSEYALGAGLGALVLLSIAAVATWLIGRHRIAGRLHRLIGRLRRRAPPDAPGFAGDVDRAIEQILARRGGIAAAVVLSVAARVVLGAELYAGFRVLGVPLSADVALVLAAVPVFLGLAGAIVPSQLGIQEGSLALVASLLGVPAGTAVAVALLQRIRQLITTAIGWALIAARRANPGWNGRCTSLGAKIMRARIVAFASTLLTALLLGPSLAHLLALPRKLALPPADYLTVQQIYRGWALVGVLIGAALIATAWLCIVVRTNRPVLRLALPALGAQILAQAIFWMFTYPANVATRGWTILPADWLELRAQWEWSHAAGAIANVIAVACLIGASIRVGATTPRRQRAPGASAPVRRAMPNNEPR